MKKNVLILTGADEKMHDVLDLTIPSKLKYARKYGYDFMTLSSFRKYPEYNINSSNDVIDLAFSRTIYMFQMLEHYDVIMWLDGDSIITNDNYNIETFLTEEHCLYFSYDWAVAEDGSTNHSGFNAGNFILQSTKEINELFSGFVNTAQYYLNDVGTDQACFNAMYKFTEFKKYIKILDHKYLNSVPESILTTSVWSSCTSRSGPNRTHTIVNPWTENSFIAHLTGCSAEDRVQLLKGYFQKFL
jgi:lipopolysaccharide biosynthesis glycosyltransferase